MTTTQYTPAHEAAFEAFTRSIQSESSGEDYGYPLGATYLAADMEGLGSLLMESLREGRDTVIVSRSGFEVLVRPVSLKAVARLFWGVVRRMPVEVYFRPEPSPARSIDDGAEVGIRGTVSRHSTPLPPRLNHVFS